MIINREREEEAKSCSGCASSSTAHQTVKTERRCNGKDTKK